MVASGLDTEQWTFHGFLPEKAGARRTALEALARTSPPCTHIFYEAPHRILDTLADLNQILGPRAKLALARELTKLHEEHLRGTPSQLRDALGSRDRIRGEFVLLLEIGPEAAIPAPSLAARIAELQTAENLPEKEALKQAARERGLSKSEAYREWQRTRAKK